jgi:Zn-dependent protease/CBS domain-containing protein
MATASTVRGADREARGAAAPRLGSGRLVIAEVWGIRIAVHASWLVVFALVTWSLAAGYFPQEFPGWTRATYWLVGALTALVFFLSVLVHELGHSWVALRHGIPIRGITLFVFGGVAQIEQEPASPATELQVALAGPFTSFGLAALFAGAWFLTRDVVVVAGPALWLARINAMVGLFNLIPGFPLDGGRVLRALVWQATGSFHRATSVASVAGRLIAVGLMGIGVFTALGGNVLGGIWFLFIGWFLDNAAAATQAQAGLSELLRGVTVAQAMTRECSRVPPDRTLSRLVREEVLGSGRRCFLVTDDGRLRGLVTLHQIKQVSPEDWDAVTAEEVMTPLAKLAVAGPEESLLAALQKMDDGDVAQLPVIAGEELLGMVGREQILHYVRTRAEIGV